MQIQFKGGKERVVSSEDNQRVEELVEREEVRQFCCGVEYYWPERGSVLSVEDSVGYWLLAKRPEVLVQLPSSPSAKAPSHPHQIVAVVPPKAVPVEPNREVKDTKQPELQPRR